MLKKTPFAVSLISPDAIEREYREFYNIENPPRDPNQRKVIEELSQLPVDSYHQIVMLRGWKLDKQTMDKLDMFVIRRSEKEPEKCLCMIPASDACTGMTDVISFFVPSSEVLNNLQAKGFITRQGINALKRDFIGSPWIN